MFTNTEIKTLKAHLALNVKNVEQSIEFYKKMKAPLPGFEYSKSSQGPEPKDWQIWLTFILTIIINVLLSS
jgi:catechol 2,3-dioxygenase-like lactoylglutathione lyase family enzyme